MDENASSLSAEGNSSELTSTEETVNSSPTITDSTPSSSSDASNSKSQDDKNSNNTISSTSDEVDKAYTQNISEIEKEVESFASEYNLSTVPAGKTTENVEDIVTDLENLLGDSSDNIEVKDNVQSLPQSEQDEDVVSENVDKEVNENVEKEVSENVENGEQDVPTAEKVSDEMVADVSTTKQSDPTECIDVPEKKEEADESPGEVSESLSAETQVNEISTECSTSQDEIAISKDYDTIENTKESAELSTEPVVNTNVEENIAENIEDVQNANSSEPLESSTSNVDSSKSSTTNEVEAMELDSSAATEEKVEETIEDSEESKEIEEVTVQENEAQNKEETAEVMDTTEVEESAKDPLATENSYEDELLKAAQEASLHQESKVIENKTPETVVTSNNSDEPEKSYAEQEEIDLIKAAQDCQNRQDDDLQQSTYDVAENDRLHVEKLSESQQIEYQKPLNIVVDNMQSIVKEAESTTAEDSVEVKESSDEDKQEEYSSKISGQNQELKLTIRKTKGDDGSILKIYDPQEPIPVIEISPSESETDGEDHQKTSSLKYLQGCSPKMMSPLKITIKPLVKPEDGVQEKASPKLKIKPIVKPIEEEPLQHHSPKITIKPIPKPDEMVESSCSPKIIIKPLVKPVESSVSPKIKIKPIVKPEESTNAPPDEERIVLKITKNAKMDETEKLAKIKLKFSMDGEHAHIVNESESGDVIDISPDEEESSNQRQEEQPVAKKPRLDLSASSVSNDESSIVSDAMPDDEAKSDLSISTPEVPVFTPRRRGRPRKVPLEVRRCGLEDEEMMVLEEQPAQSRSGRPKRSCRGPSVRDTLGMKPRKPRERGRGRGRGRGAKTLEKKERKSQSKLKLIKESAITAQVSAAFEQPPLEFLDDSCNNIGANSSSVTGEDSFGKSLETRGNSDVVMYEEETRMSADINNSRAQTPAKQVSIPSELGIDESQSSVQSTATTESAKVKKTKMEIEPEGAVISADQLAEYYWGGGGPYMLQEQVAQFLGIKSFKRKYPGIQRRTVDMQERDFIRESGLASEHLCDLGLTAVNSADILDLMYSDFQYKYEEYCKHQRDRQTKDITNKQKALSLAASQEKNKLDIMQQAVESAFQWNHNFNRTRLEDRRACMDLQTFTINFPKGRAKQIPKPKTGHYPIALVPGQYTDYYKAFTPTELNNLPLNTMLYRPINIPNEEDSQSDGSGTETESTSSGSESSDSESTDDDCNICSLTPGGIKVEKKEYT